MPVARLRNKLLAGLLVVAVVPVFCQSFAGASGLTPRTMQQLSSVPDATTDYTLQFTISNSITLGSLSVTICSNTPIEGDNCDLPAGFDLTNAQLTAQSGITDFTMFNVATNSVLLSHAAAPVTAPQAVSLTFHNVVNPTAPGPYYVRIAAYSSTNGTGTSVAFGGLAFDVNNNVQVNSYVPPYLTFCAGLTIPTFDCASASGNYVNFGGLSASRSSQDDSQLLVATNAANGYSIQVYGTTMTSGNNIIAALGNNAGSHPGNAQFGINLRANSVPPVGGDPIGPGSGQPASGYDTPNSYRFVSNDIIASSQAADDWRRYTVSYLVNVPAGQAPGVYASTLTYVGAGSF